MLSKRFPAPTRPKIEGEVITDARQDYDPISGGVVVEMSMNKHGADVWATLTGREC